MSNDLKYSSIHYNEYLQVDKILDAQKLRSVEVEGKVAHEEMLFIITHQVYELWFKQVIHEIESINEMFDDGYLSAEESITCVNRLDRIVEIIKLTIQQIAVLETMTPLDFLDFRNYLFPASGFQSFQFREIEVMLGLKNEQRHTYHNTPYHAVFDEKKQARLKELEEGMSLLQQVEAWLERTPFLEFKDFDFLEHYKKAVRNMLNKEQAAIKSTEILSEKYKQMRLTMLGDTDSYFGYIFDENMYNELVSAGNARMSYKATVAALLINLYRDEPIFQQPFQLLNKLVEVDEFLTTWRYRHAQMVLRMLGKKVGTGGSSGHEYLSKTASEHQIFKDLHNISTFLIPRSELPELPKELKEQLNFHFSTKKKNA